LFAATIVGCSSINTVHLEPDLGETISVSLGNTIMFGDFEIELGEEIGFAPLRYIDAFYIPLSIINIGEEQGHPELQINSFGPDWDWLRNAGSYFDDDFSWFWDWIDPGERIESKVYFQYIGDGEYTLEINSLLQDGDIRSRELGFFELVIEVAWPEDIELLEEEGVVRDFGVDLDPDFDLEAHFEEVLDNLGIPPEDLEWLEDYLNSIPTQEVLDNATDLVLGDTFIFGNFEVEIGEEIGFTVSGNTDVFYVSIAVTNIGDYRDYHQLWSNTNRIGPDGNSLSYITGEEFPEGDIYGLGELEPSESIDARIYVHYIGNAQYMLRFTLREDMTCCVTPVIEVFDLVVYVRKP